MSVCDAVVASSGAQCACRRGGVVGRWRVGTGDGRWHAWPRRDSVLYGSGRRAPGLHGLERQSDCVQLHHGHGRACEGIRRANRSVGCCERVGARALQATRVHVGRRCQPGTSAFLQGVPVCRDSTLALIALGMSHDAARAAGYYPGAWTPRSACNSVEGRVLVRRPAPTLCRTRRRSAVASPSRASAGDRGVKRLRARSGCRPARGSGAVR